MIFFNDIRDGHLEISTICNAACPFCPRNFWGYPYNGGLHCLTVDIHRLGEQPDYWPLRGLTGIYTYAV